MFHSWFKILCSCGVKGGSLNPNRTQDFELDYVKRISVAALHNGLHGIAWPRAVYQDGYGGLH
jgi:hypothetical protein